MIFNPFDFHIDSIEKKKILNGLKLCGHTFKEMKFFDISLDQDQQRRTQDLLHGMRMTPYECYGLIEFMYKSLKKRKQDL